MAAGPVRYVESGGLDIAYRTFGSGEQDMLMVLPSLGTVELITEPPVARLTEGLGAFTRLIAFDRRGAGLSDRTVRAPTLEEQMEDVNAVLDATGATRVAVTAEAEAAMLAVMFAASHPDRVSHLFLLHGMPRLTRAEGWEWPWTEEERNEQRLPMVRALWGTGESGAVLAPVMASKDPGFIEWWGRWERLSGPPQAMIERLRLAGRMDVREILPRVQAPTLVADRPEAAPVDSRHAAYMAERIPNATFRELPGRDGISFGDGIEAYLDAVEEFVTGTSSPRAGGRALATVLFTDIVGSTSKAATLGDRRWRTTLEGHDRVTRETVAAFGGRAVKSTGDGFLATFDGPARAVRCATELERRVHDLGVELRGGLHAGEVELIGDDVGGMAVHIGARIGALAGAGEVLASSTVRDLVVGSGIVFDDRGEHELKGVPGSWRVFAASDPGDG